MKRLLTFVLAVAAGVCISIGGTVFLLLESKILGALMFTVGLFTICTFGYNLFTGKVCYVFDNSLSYALDIPIIWAGNLLGTWLSARLELLTRIGPELARKAAAVCGAKLDDGLLSIFVLAVFCNMLIYIAVENFKNNPHESGKYLGLFFGVVVFILCGFEHCVANMYFFSAAGVCNGKALLYLLVMSLGNAAGGVVFPLIRKMKQRDI